MYSQYFRRLFWLLLVIVAFYSTVYMSLQSLDRYETKSTVVSIEKDHYYWNTSMPSLTICPVVNRIDRGRFDEYCEGRGISGQDKEEFYEFIETMANATYDSFGLITNHSSIQVYSTVTELVLSIKSLKRCFHYRNWRFVLPIT